jgi:predicted membrane channel-forming protein YqfA (hemolysin III family)
VTDPDKAREALEREEQAESIKERLEREHGEMMEELRALIPGAEVQFGFLLAICFTSEFQNLTQVQCWVYYATLVFTGSALVLLMSPAAHHRMRFREGDKERILRKGNRDAIAGSLLIGIAFTGVVYLVTSLVFATVPAIIAAVLFLGLIVWRWWLPGLRPTRTEG